MDILEPRIKLLEISHNAEEKKLPCQSQGRVHRYVEFAVANDVLPLWGASSRDTSADRNYTGRTCAKILPSVESKLDLIRIPNLYIKVEVI